jgi:putative hydrolase of the HAD superfamily
MIKNIIFDLGGVLLNIDYEKTSKAFRDLGVENFDEMYSQLTADPLFRDLEMGRINEEAFYAAMKRAAKDDKLTDEQIDTAWNAMLLDFREDTMSFLETISEKYRLFLLSNTNIIHLKAFEKILHSFNSKESLDSYFEKAYYSHQIGYRKPNADAFEFVLEKHALIAAETLFIDDSSPNIETAKALGIQTILLKPGMAVEEINFETH